MQDRQIALEGEQLELGQTRYLNLLKTKGRAEMGPGRLLIAGNVDKMVTAINAALVKKRGPRAAYLTALGQVEPVAAAMLALRTILQQVDKTKGATAIATNIGQMLVEHLNWKRIHHHEEKEVAKGARFMEQKVLKHKGHEKHRRFVANHYVAGHLPPESTVEWDKATMVQVGMLLLELVAAETMLIKLPVVFKHGNKLKMVELTDETAAWLKEQDDRYSLLDPLFMPMVVPPKPWSTPTNGGYLTRRQFLVKQDNEKYQAFLRTADLSAVYAAVNLMQETPFKINIGVLNVMRAAMESNAAVAGLVDQELEPENAKPADIKTNTEARKAWKQLERERHDRNAAKRNQRLVNMRILNLAEKFKGEEAIYFPHTLDFRGRAYPVPVDLQPQGSDQAKGLLTFADGKPLGQDGLFWLKVHVANLFGVDKVNFEERVQWVNENLTMLMECAISPLDVDFWQQADKPWQALAAIFELFGAVVADDHREYVSHLPIAMDGSCNGLQNLSAMMLDEEGGKATNLVPADKPQDIYTQVLDRTVAKLTERASLILGDMEEHDRAVVLLNVGLNRKIVKRPVMTRPYGSTGFGVRDMIVSEMRKQGMYDKLPGDKAEQFAHVMLLAGLVEESINEVVVASKQVMDWLQECARVAADAGRAISWVAPSGFPAVQDYRMVMSDLREVFVGGMRRQFRLMEKTDDVNKRRQASGMSPNVIHSFDASHMMLTILRAAEEFNIRTFCMVHDSYATHACNVGELAASLRAVFIEMYSTDRLCDLFIQFTDQLPIEVAAKLPAPPARGTLDLTKVEDSYYFFA